MFAIHANIRVNPLKYHTILDIGTNLELTSLQMRYSWGYTVSRSFSNTAARLAAGVALAVLSAAGAANATTYALDNVQFDDGTFASGEFKTNVYGYISSWDITTVDGAIIGNHYTPTINAGYNPGDVTITFNRNDYVGFLQLTLTSPLSGSGKVPLVTGFGGPSFECDTYACPSPSADVRYVAGRPTINAVPEPATWAMLIGGFGLIGAAARRRRTDGVLDAA